MKNNKNQQVVQHLNIILRNELVAINQYFLHAKILEDQGFTKLAALTKAESIDEMKHADIIIARILFLKGAPKMTDYKKINIADSVEEMLKSDLQLEVEAIADTQAMQQLLSSKGVPAWFDYWGYDVPHDWTSWRDMMPYFLEKIL
jgi:bacterioferritin